MSQKAKSESFIRALCFGEIIEEMIFPFPEIKSDEREVLKSSFDSFGDWLGPLANEFRKWDVKGELPPEFLEQMKEFGLFSLIIPDQYGGLGFSASAYSRAIQELAKHDASVAITAGAHSSIGMRGLLLFGTEEQKGRYFPKLATGEMIAAFCLTEPGAGSDAASIKTKAERKDGKWVINGEKLWITNGGIADFFTVFAKTDTDEGKITAFIVTRDMPGVTSGPHEDKMGIRASSTTTVNFENVVVGDEQVLGSTGKGFKVAMSILNSGRTGLGGGCVGAMKGAMALASKQAKQRIQFGKPIAEFGLVKQKLGNMVIDCFVSESLVSLVAGLVDRGYSDYAVEAAISKVFATECLWRTIDEALQIAGGNGYMREFPYERIMRDSRINRIFEGTNDILRLFIALTAMNDVGKDLKELKDSLQNVFSDPLKGFGVFTEYVSRQASIRGGFSQGMTKAHPALSEGSRCFEQETRKLATFTEQLLRKHGKRIVDKQFATQRLANVMIDLFALAAVIGRVTQMIERQNVDKCAKEIEIVKAFAGQCRRRIDSNFSEIDNNEDDWVRSLADDLLTNEEYRWDTI